MHIYTAVHSYVYATCEHTKTYTRIVSYIKCDSSFILIIHYLLNEAKMKRNFQFSYVLLIFSLLFKPFITVLCTLIQISLLLFLLNVYEYYYEFGM